MSIKIPLNKLSIELRENVLSKLTFTPEQKSFVKNKFANLRGESVYAFDIDYSDNIYLPFCFSLFNMQQYITLPKISDYYKINVNFKGILRKGQEEVYPQIKENIKRNGFVKLAFYPGFGKTTLSIFLSAELKLKTVILCHRIVLINQWKETIEKNIENPKIQILKSGDTLDSEAEFIIISAVILPKLGWIFENVGTLIVDEIHTFATKTLSKSLNYFTPRYLIGLSATPYRSDGMDKLLNVYFGEDYIERKLQRVHSYYRVQTKLEPEIKTNEKGELIWASIIDWQSKSESRNNMIIDIVLKHKDRTFLILCKRIEQAKVLKDKLLEVGENVDTLIGNSTVFNKESRILIATIQKCGVGFSHDILNALIIASDCEEYFIQYLGRVMRTEEGEPIVFDLVDDHPTLKRHYAFRKKISKEHGGLIKEYNFNLI